MIAAGCLAVLRFDSPGYLVLLAVIPLLIVLSFRSLAGLGPIRRVIALCMRTVVVACMVLALAGAEWARVTDDLSVVFLFDRSNSVPRPQQQEAFDFIERSQSEIRPTKDRLGVVAFDGASLIEQLPAGSLGLKRISAPASPDQTNVAAALRMGMALFTNDS